MTFRNIADISSNTRDCRQFKASNDYPLPYNKVGIEIEVESPPSVRSLQVQGLWQAKRDNSLRAVDGREGVELITLPIFGEDINTALDQLEPVFSDGSATFSSRTSVHIHVEVTDLNKEDLIKLLLLYTALERILFKYCGNNRDNNLYCLPYYKSAQFIVIINEVFNSIEEEDGTYARRSIGKWPKYSSLNLKRILDLGTIEFRLHHGTVDAVEIKRWIQILLAIKKYAVERVASINTFPDIVSGFSVEEYLIDIFGEELVPHLLYEGAGNDLIKGVRVAQDILLYNSITDLNINLFNGNLYKSRESSYTRLFKEEVDAKLLSVVDIVEYTDTGRRHNTPPPVTRGITPLPVTF